MFRPHPTSRRGTMEQTMVSRVNLRKRYRYEFFSGGLNAVSDVVVLVSWPFIGFFLY
jgi:hypothetical protein